MHEQRRPLPTEAEDLDAVRDVLTHVIETHPDPLRPSDLILELGDPEDFGERDRIERALTELVRAGLVFRAASVLFPTRSALRAFAALRR
jgi:hypothetical protein